MAVSGLYLLHGIGRREQRVVAALAHIRALLDDRQPLAGDALASIERLQAVLHDKVSAVKRMRTLACDLTVATGTLVSGFTEAVATADRHGNGPRRHGGR
jgi:methyl-accepting chemotaxis protein